MGTFGKACCCFLFLLDKLVKTLDLLLASHLSYGSLLGVFGVIEMPPPQLVLGGLISSSVIAKVWRLWSPPSTWNVSSLICTRETSFSGRNWSITFSWECSKWPYHRTLTAYSD